MTWPLGAVLALAILFLWPGLKYHWRFNESWYLTRGESQFMKDEAVLRLGAVSIFKAIYNEGESRLASLRGFENRNDRHYWSLQYRSEGGSAGFVVVKRMLLFF